jgi:hypothetical protein
MSSNKKHFDIERIVHNAELLSIPEIYDNFLYECEDPDGFHEVEEEIDELGGLLPEDISILDLPKIICGNKRTRVYGKAICSATNGHSIINSSLPVCVVFQSEDEAIRLGYRPCAKCMQQEYAKWKAHKR